METYPKIKYHVRGGGSVCVASAEQEKALGGEWLDHKPFVAAPVSVDIPVPVAEQPQPAKKFGNARAK